MSNNTPPQEVIKNIFHYNFDTFFLKVDILYFGFFNQS